MRTIHIIGIGAGDPDHVTIQAIKAMNEVDVFFIPDKGREKAELKHLRTQMLARHVVRPGVRTVEVDIPRRARSESYQDDVGAWHAAIEARYEALMREHLGEDECGGFLVWGDPTLYDSTLRIVARIAVGALPLDYDVIPGISSVQALAARHRIPLNTIGEPVTIVPGRRLDQAVVDAGGSVVVVLDGECAFNRIEGDVDIFWGASIGSDDECLVAGALSDVKDTIEAVRTRKKQEKGWIMDTYLLRKRDGGPN